MSMISVNDLLGSTWYIQEITIKDEHGEEIVNTSNWKLQSDIYREIRNRWVRSVGAMDDKLIVTVI